MPFKSALRKSLLNVQPIEAVIETDVSDIESPSRPKARSGFNSLDLGFSEFIERQVANIQDSADSIALSGIQDSGSALKVSSDPQRPELIALTRPFAKNPRSIIEFLKLKSFESSLDEADYQQFILSYQSLQNIGPSRQILQTSDRIDLAFKERNKLNDLLLGISEITFGVDQFRDSADFLLNSANIHEASIAIMEEMPLRFKKGNIDPNLKRTFSNLPESNALSNSVLFMLLAYSLLMPGSIRFKTFFGQAKEKNRFYVPGVSSNPAAKLLSSLSTINIKNRIGFRKAQSLLPSDPVKRLAVISEALSYELMLSAGLNRLPRPNSANQTEKSNLATYLTNYVGLSTSPIFDPPPDGTYLSSILNPTNPNSLPLEMRDAVVRNASYPGAVTSLIDPSIVNSTLDFTELKEFAQNLSKTCGKYADEVRTLRCFDEDGENFSGVSLIREISNSILSGMSSLRSPAESIDKTQVSQMAYFSELSRLDSKVRSVDRIFESFLSIFNYRELIPGEQSPVSSTETIQRPPGDQQGPPQLSFSTGQNLNPLGQISTEANLDQVLNPLAQLQNSISSAIELGSSDNGQNFGSLELLGINYGSQEASAAETNNGSNFWQSYVSLFPETGPENQSENSIYALDLYQIFSINSSALSQIETSVADSVGSNNINSASSSKVSSSSKNSSSSTSSSQSSSTICD